MKIESSAFKNNSHIPSKFTCDGENISPPLKISGLPKDAKIVVLIVDDPDAPNGTWTHWTVWNLPVAESDLPENIKPDAIEGITSFGKPGYGGPCPPSGTHRYYFKAFALRDKINLPVETKATDLERAVSDQVIDKAELVGLYSRK